jgi:D-alanine-D-alanine ligase-like ATP-grasp enzyme
MGDKVTTIIHRKSRNQTHLNNTSKGGSAELVDVDLFPQKIKDQALVMAKFYHREVSGIDMICHKETGEYYFLETNNLPQLSTGSNVKTKLKALDLYLSNIAAN